MIHLIFEKADGTVIKGLQQCSVQEWDTKEMVDSDLNHGAISPGETSTIQSVSLRTYSWVNNGPPDNAITDVQLFIAPYYTDDVTYVPDPGYGYTFCGGAESAVFGDYTSSGGSRSAASDYATLISWGDQNQGVMYSLDLGRTFASFKTGSGEISTRITIPATCMDIGAIDGQLDPGDRATLHFKISVPSSYNDPTNVGIYLFNIGVFYNYVE